MIGLALELVALAVVVYVGVILAIVAGLALVGVVMAVAWLVTVPACAVGRLFVRSPGRAVSPRRLAPPPYTRPRAPLH